MKKNLLLILTAFFWFATANAQTDTSQIYNHPKVPAMFPGGEKAFMKYNKEKIAEITNKWHPSFPGMVRIVVEKDGKISSALMVEGLSPGIDSAITDLMLKSPSWTPASTGGQVVRSRTIFLIQFPKSNQPAIAPEGGRDKWTEPATELVFTAVQEPPTFPGGIAKMYEFIKSNIVKPNVAPQGDKSREIISFIVEKDGSLSDIYALWSLGDAYDAEAIRVLKLSPKWDPGKQNGNAVRVMYALPVDFK